MHSTTATWQELIPMIEAASVIKICFSAHDGKEYVRTSMEIPKEAALKRARWGAKEHPKSKPQSVLVAVVPGGVLWFGGR